MNVQLARPMWSRTSLTSSLFAALAAIGLSAGLLGFVDFALVPWSGNAAEDIVFVDVVAAAWIFVFAGLLAWGRRPNNRLGPVC
jgi:hypothetical protein